LCFQTIFLAHPKEEDHKSDCQLKQEEDLALLSQVVANDKILEDTLQGVNKVHPKHLFLLKLLAEAYER
jgi:hypothetical protein